MANDTETTNQVELGDPPLRKISVIFVVLLGLLCGGYFLINRQPEPVPAITPTPVLIPTQPTAKFPPAATSTPTSIPIPNTPTPLPTNTPTPEATATASPTLSPSDTPVPTATPDPCAGVEGEVYEIQPGDTLWFIAGCLGNPFDWPRLAELNGLENPHLIHAGNELRLKE